MFTIKAPGGTQSRTLSALIVAFIFQGYLLKYKKAWFKQYAFVLGAAFDGGTGVCLLAIFILKFFNIAFPLTGPLTPAPKIPYDYYCFADLSFNSRNGNYSGSSTDFNSGDIVTELTDNHVGVLKNIK